MEKFKVNYYSNNQFIIKRSLNLISLAFICMICLVYLATKSFSKQTKGRFFLKSRYQKKTWLDILAYSSPILIKQYNNFKKSSLVGFFDLVYFCDYEVHHVFSPLFIVLNLWNPKKCWAVRRRTCFVICLKLVYIQSILLKYCLFDWKTKILTITWN